MPTLVSRAFLCIALLCSVPLTGIALAQSYPSKPIKLVVPYPPGGSTDILARLLADRMSTSLGQNMLVENRAGATGVIGAEAVARSTADGYTLLMGAGGPITQVAAIRPSMPYDSLKDFAPVILTAKAPKLLVVNPAVPADSPQKLVAFLKSKQREARYGSVGTGSSGHLANELLKLSAGVEMTHVPYKGGAQVITDLMAGHIDVVMEVIPQLLPLVRSGKIRALAISSATRSPLLPDTPTLAESGFPGYESYTWFGILAPAGTPAAIVERLNAEFGKILTTPELKKRLEDLGADFAPNTAGEYAKFLRDDLEKWRRVVQQAGIKE